MRTTRLLIFLLVLTLFTTVKAFTQDMKPHNQEIIKPRMRVILINDFGGDPDGLFQLAHQVLSPSAEIRGIIGSFIRTKGFFDAPESAASAVKEAKKILALLHSDTTLVVEGANIPLTDLKTSNVSEGARLIIKEAMRTDTKLPLYILCGGGLTDIASAYLMEPNISKNITLVWIGGAEYPGTASPPPGAPEMEYNLGIDLYAAQVIFNHSDIQLWQVPRNTYRLAIVSYSELLVRIKKQGEIGKYLVEKIEWVMHLARQNNFSTGETYILGDNPLVLLTALQSSFDADPSSSLYFIKNAPLIDTSGHYQSNSNDRSIRIYKTIDNRLMFEDFYYKLVLFNQSN